MATRLQRLRKLLDVQRKVTALHEQRHAAHLAAAIAAAAEAVEITGRFNDPASLSMTFPEVYHRRIGAALARESECRRLAAEEAARLAVARARADRVERAWREEARLDERRRGDGERLELIAALEAHRES